MFLFIFVKTFLFLILSIYLKGELVLLDVVKALFYTCSSFPKIAAPHRYSPADDYDICVLSSLSSSLEIYSKVVKNIEEFKRGERSLKDLEIGRNMARALSSTVKNIGYSVSVEMCISSTYLVYIDIFQNDVENDFYKAVRKIFTALYFMDVVDSIEFVKILKNIGGKYYVLLDKADISEKRIMVENLSLGHVMEILAKHNSVFKCFSNVQKVIEIINQSSKIFEETKNINKTLFKLFIDAAKNKIENLRESFIELLKIDIAYRKKNIDFSYILPCLAYAALYIIKTK